MDLKDKQRNVLHPLVPKPCKGKFGRPAQDLRKVLNGILWVRRAGVPQHDMPGRYPLDKKLCKRNIKLVAPHKHNRKRKATQDVRTLRRYVKRWKVEELLHGYRTTEDVQHATIIIRKIFRDLFSSHAW